MICFFTMYVIVAVSFYSDVNLKMYMLICYCLDFSMFLEVLKHAGVFCKAVFFELEKFIVLNIKY